MNAATSDFTPRPNDEVIVLADVFASIRKASDTSEKVTGSLILGLFTHEASFDKSTLEYYFKTEAAKRKDVQTTILSTNDEEFKNEIRFLEAEKEKEKRDRNTDQIETILRRHKSLRNMFHSCMQACYFLRVGGNLAGNDIGAVKSIKMVKDRFVVSYIDDEGEVTRLQGKFSSAAIIKSGATVVDKLLGKKKTTTTTTSVNVSPISMVNSAVSTFNTMIDVAINEQTAIMQKDGANLERATLDDMPDDVVSNIDMMLSKLLIAKFAADGRIETIDVTSWMTDTIKAVEVVDVKQTRPLRKAS